jgi:flagellar P-ring protein FlgI
VLLTILIIAGLALSTCASPTMVCGLRDLVMVAGARDNQLVGFGLVAGLANDGDKDPIYTQQTIANMLQRYGINVQPRSGANLGKKRGRRHGHGGHSCVHQTRLSGIDVQVASMGDAKSLQGGVLLQTPLLGADNKVYAVAQGPIAVGGFTAGSGGGGGATVTKNHPTWPRSSAAQLSSGKFQRQIVHDDTWNCLLREPSFISVALWPTPSMRFSPTRRTRWIRHRSASSHAGCAE